MLLIQSSFSLVFIRLVASHKLTHSRLISFKLDCRSQFFQHYFNTVFQTGCHSSFSTVFFFFYEDTNVGKCKVTEVEVKAEEAAEDNLKITMSLHSSCWRGEICHKHLNWQGWSLELHSTSDAGVILCSSRCNSWACADCLVFKTVCCLPCFSQAKSA